MKMSDEFNLPVKVNKHKINASWYIADSKDYLVCSILDEDEAKCVANAINCHDDMYNLLDILSVDLQVMLGDRAKLIIEDINALLKTARGDNNE